MTQTIDLPRGLIWLGPFALLGMALEKPFTAAHKILARSGRKWLATWYLVLAGLVINPVPPVRADFIGLDLIPLAGSLLADIRSFYLEYQDQIQMIKRMAVSYYYLRSIDLGRLKNDIGYIAELELEHATAHWVNDQVTGYIAALTYTGDSRNTNEDDSPVGHEGTQNGLRFGVDNPDGTTEYLTTSQIWNRMFNPYDPGWDPVMTHETYLVLMARYRWLSRELGRYRKAVNIWQRLFLMQRNLYLEGIGIASISEGIQHAIGADINPDIDQGVIKNHTTGPVKLWVEGRIDYWHTKIREAENERIHVKETLIQIRASMTQMERRALGMVAAKIKKYSLENWNYHIPATGPGKRRFAPTAPKHFSPFPKGWL